MKSIPDGSIDMILCDLPYGMTNCKWDSILPFDALWEQYKRVAKPSAAIILTSVQPFTTALISSNPKHFKYACVWIKTNCTGFANAKKQPLRSYEDVLVFYRKQPTYHPQGIVKLASPRIRTKETGSFMRSTFRDGYAQRYTNYPKNVLTFASERNTIHPTQKPVALFEYLIRTYTNPGELVLDNCMGGGTTAIACMNSGRDFIGFETDPDYFSIATKRIENHTTESPKAFVFDDLFCTDLQPSPSISD